MKFFTNLYHSAAIAFAFLTRLPVPGIKSISFSPRNLSGSLVFYPFVGLFFGVLSLGIVGLASWAQIDKSLTAFVVLALPFLLNRFLHFDGFCDVVDAFLADKSREQRLEILKDSRIGSFALGAAILLLLGKFLLIQSLLEHGQAAFLLFAPIVSRWLMVPMAYRAVYPRKTGTGLAIVGQVRAGHLAWSVVCFALVMSACVVMLVEIDFPKFWIEFLPETLALSCAVGIVLCFVWLIVFRRISNRAIGGVTGDVLGCLAETSELLFIVGVGLALMIATNWC